MKKFARAIICNLQLQVFMELHIHKQTCSFQLQIYLLVYKLLLEPGIKGLRKD